MAPGLKIDCGDVNPPSGEVREKKNPTSTRKTDGKTVGSRRIFAPQFKLQVLDSYRKDSDCRGNQRATARKYGIHRRQIQKWLQAEASLRTTVEVSPNINEVTSLNLSARAARLRDDIKQAVCQQEDIEPSPHSYDNIAPSEIVAKECKPVVHREVRVSMFPTVKIEVTEREDIRDTEPSDDDLDDEITLSDAEHPLDFTCATLSKRRSFSLQFKLDVLNAFRSDELCKGNQRATARKFGINRRQVQKWLGQESELRDEAASHGGLFRQRLGRLLETEESKNTEENTMKTVVEPPLTHIQYRHDSIKCNPLEPQPTHIKQSQNYVECGWDLSLKKRKIDHEFYSESKRVIFEPYISDIRGSWHEVLPTRNTEPHERALCLVKDRSSEEFTSFKTVSYCPEPSVSDCHVDKMHEEFNAYYAKSDSTYSPPIVLPMYHVPNCCVAPPHHMVTFCHNVTDECKHQEVSSYPVDFTVDYYVGEPQYIYDPHYPNYKWYKHDTLYQGGYQQTPAVINMYQ